MARYTVHVPKDRADRLAEDEGTIFLRDGWSWGAFAFGPLWLFWNRCWIAGLLAGAAHLAVLVAIAFLPIPDGAKFLAILMLAFLWGIEGASLCRFDLRQSGYAEVGVVAGSDRDVVEQRFFTSRAVPVAAPPAEMPAFREAPRGPWSPGVIGSLPDSRKTP